MSSRYKRIFNTRIVDVTTKKAQKEKSMGEVDIEVKAETIGNDEDQRWRNVHASIVEEVRRTRADYEQDRHLARDLTSQIVAARRDEDKAALASDEAVAHGLTRLRKAKSTGLESLAEQPYFARVVTQENGRDVEFRLGTASFPAQRIIDWRKAPISKLYYDYREGDDFSETIQGIDREGIIKLRRGYKGIENELHRIETPQGILTHTESGWAFQKGTAQLSRTEEQDGHLPPILSLITSEQFGLITRDITKPIVIQGIAGSGKTTVALHRLAWLLHEDNSSARPERCLVVMYNRSLKAYVENTLPELKIDKVPIRTFTQWADQLLNELVGPRPRGPLTKGRETELFKSSSVCLNLLFDFISKNQNTSLSVVENLLAFYQSLLKQDIIWRKWDLVKKELKEQTDRKVCDLQDDALLLHLIYSKHGYYPVRRPESLGLCDHIVIDEAQDFGMVEIRALLNAIDREKTVTIVGDVAQKIVGGRDFGSWEKLLTEAGFTDTTPIALTVSYRSTQEIMSLAAKVRGVPLSESEAYSSGRSGPVPSLIKVDHPSMMANRIGQWVAARIKDSSKSLSAVICRWPKHAQDLVDELRKLGYSSVRLGYRDQFDFSPGVVITNIQQVKGLEFRNVLVVEPSVENYQASNPEEQNLLYVAVTRAEVRLDFIGCKKTTPLLPNL